jgi:hypothetical protein
MHRDVEPVLSRDCSRTLLEKAFDGVDPLGYESSGGDMEDVDCDVEQVNHMDELAATALRGEDGRAIAALRALTTGTSMDDATAALLTSMGMSPVVVEGLRHVVATLRDPLEIIDLSSDGEEVIVIGDDRRWTIRFGQEAVWSASLHADGGVRTLSVAAVPHVVATAATPGTALSRLVSHPVLDALDLRISATRIGGDRLIIDIA